MFRLEWKSIFNGSFKMNDGYAAFYTEGNKKISHKYI